MAQIQEKKNNYEEIENELGLDEDGAYPAENEYEEEEDDDDDYWDEDDGPVNGGRAASANRAAIAAASARATNTEQLFAKVQGRINLEPVSERSGVEKSVSKMDRKEDDARYCIPPSCLFISSLSQLPPGSATRRKPIEQRASLCSTPVHA